MLLIIRLAFIGDCIKLVHFDSIGIRLKQSNKTRA